MSSVTEIKKPKKKKFISLPMQILLALVLGVVVGAMLNGKTEYVNYFQPLGDIFLHLIKMIVVPIVFCSLVISIAGTGDMKTVGRYGWKTLLYFEIITTIAIGLGIIFANVFKPGSGIDKNLLPKGDVTKYTTNAEAAAESTYGNHMIDTIVNIIPTNIIDSMAQGQLLPVIFFSVFFGLGLAAIGKKGEPVKAFFDGFLDVIFWMTNQIMKYAPIGVFAFMAVTIINLGLGALIPLAKLALVVAGSMIFFIIVVLGGVAALCKINIFHLLVILKEELILAFSTSSSETVLPKIMEKMEKFGAPKEIVSFVVPTGYTFNLDGSALYQSIAALTIAQMYGVHLSVTEQLVLLITLMLTSKGMAAVPGTSIVVLITTLTAMNIHPEGLALIIGIDRILDMMRTVVNVVGNSLSTLVIARWEGRLDYEKGRRYYETFKKK
ncbi:cation:dicarboxylate symporter family transporter [Macrococcoides bohemicum]|uniref:cation:dicarboxylate symporter family transporter n=1 Tax=Macrococcoides bohemicum TaxID=1903056 RepID=UPI000BB59703|nr:MULTISPECIES: cation:dicarboxylase symporter family transporter [Macrococcus]ATD29996.1 glutamate:protein symporter [Macrococcus sp. IME1552]MBC9873655.1 cation:dicarboxylase symporter family transporter [Macrococcus bohemicus]TDL40841.1 cation:dicarboxylase symporter family transporter [Macrococcus bohemicus]